MFKKAVLLIALTTLMINADGQNSISIFPENTYYFQDAKGKPVILVGDYTWDIFTDVNYDYERLFDTLKARKLNFVRLWLWKLYEWYPKDRSPNICPYMRTGPGMASDGKPKYNLDKYNPAFFHRLKKVCHAARKRGIYLQLMLFDSWMLKHDYLWKLSAYNRNNNVNNVDGDPAHTGAGKDGKQGFCSMGNPLLYKYQKAFVREVVKTVNKFDNIFYEVANENFYNEEWELSLCDYIKEIELRMPKQHMTIRRDFPSHHYVVQKWDPAKVHNGLTAKYDLKVPLIFDTDWIITKDADEVRKAAWSAIASGAHFDFMDGYFFYLKDSIVRDPIPDLHLQIGYMARFIKNIQPWKLVPDNALVRNGRAFAMSNKRIVFAYLPYGGKITLDLSGINNDLTGQWYNPRTGKFEKEFPVSAKDNSKFAAPDNKDWTLLLRSR